MPVSTPELVAREVTTPGATVLTVLPGRAELASAPGLLAIEGALSDSLWDTLEVLLDKNVLDSA